MSSFGNSNLSSITSMLSQVGPASTEGYVGPGRHQRFYRIGRMIEHLAAIASVQAVIEIIPPAPVAQRAPHHGGDGDRGGRGDVAPRFGDDAQGRLQRAQGVANRRTEFLDGHRARPSNRPGIRRRYRACEARCRALQSAQHQVATHVDGLDMHRGAGRLRTGVKRQPLDFDAQLRGEREEVRDALRVAAEFARQIGYRIGAAERYANQQRDAAPEFHELAQLVGIVDDEARDTEGQRGANIAIALDRVRVNAALGATPRRRTRSTSPLVARSKQPPRSTQRRDDRRVRQGLDRIVEIDPGQCRGEPVVLRTHPFCIDDEERRAVARDELANRIARERILSGTKLLHSVEGQIADSGGFGHVV